MPDIRKPQLIDATMEAINSVGLQKASVVMIAGFAGVSPAIINHYFGGKNDLLEATMRSVLRQLSQGVKERLQATHPDDVVGRITAIVGGNFDKRQLDSKVVKTWLAFWSQAMHSAPLYRLQQVNERRLLSHLLLELKRALPPGQARLVAQSIAALIDGIWLRGALSPSGIDGDLAQKIIGDYLACQLPKKVLEKHNDFSDYQSTQQAVPRS
jgi:TetR/AcrR family transcriptional repressor of bet genes